MKHFCLVSVCLLALPLLSFGSAHAQPATPMAAPIQLSSIRMIDAHTGWAIANNAVFHTVNGGQTWRDVMPKAAGHPPDMTPFFLTGSRAWIATDSSPQYDTARITVYRTANAGRSWQSARLSVTGAVTPGGRLTFADPHHGWLLVNKGAGAGQNPYVLMQTTDGGAHWRKVAYSDSTGSSPNAFPGCDCTEAITFRDGSVGWSTGNPFALPIKLWFYVSTDGGQRWSRQTLPVPAGYPTGTTESPVFFSSRNAVLPVTFLTQKGGEVFDLYQTHDSGAHWSGTTPLRIQINGALSYSIVDIVHGWVTDGALLYRTTDGGKHWATIRPKVPHGVRYFWPGPGQFSDTQIDFVSSTTGFAVDRASVNRQPGFVLKTTNGGFSWQRVSTLSP